MRNNYVLIIANNPETADKIFPFLEKAGCQALAVTTGARAQVQLAFTNPDVILLDMDLPDIPGEIILRQIKAQTRLKDSSLILITSDVETEKALQPQADLVLSKPIDVSQIRNLVMHSVGVSG
jgi:CheY-like chemotaxis protein